MTTHAPAHAGTGHESTISKANGNGSRLLPKITTPVPGPKSKPVVDADTEILATTTKTSPIVGVIGKGAMVQDLDGNWFVDFTTGSGVTNTGHCHPKVVSAIINQASKLIHFAGTDFYYEVQVELAKKLAAAVPGKHRKKVFFTNSGTESVEAAIKVAKWTTKKHQFISFIGGFHGRTAGANAFMANSINAVDRFFPMMPGVTKVPFAYCYRCPYKLEYPSCDMHCVKIIDELYLSKVVPPADTAAILVEPCQGEGGYIVPPKEYHPLLKEICEKHDLLFIDDEVQMGFGRTGKMMAIEHWGVVPDIVTLAKGMGSGMPIGATVFDAKLDFGVSGAHSNTYGGNLVASAAALATLEVFEEEDLVHRSEVLGKHLGQRLREIQQKYEVIGDVRGLGLMGCAEFVKDRRTKEPFHELKDQVVEEGYKRGLILLPVGPGIRFAPPLVITKEQLDAGLDIFDESVGAALKTLGVKKGAA